MVWTWHGKEKGRSWRLATTEIFHDLRKIWTKSKEPCYEHWLNCMYSIKIHLKFASLWICWTHSCVQTNSKQKLVPLKIVWNHAENTPLNFVSVFFVVVEVAGKRGPSTIGPEQPGYAMPSNLTVDEFWITCRNANN